MLQAVGGDLKLRNMLMGAIKRVWHRHPTRLQLLATDAVRIPVYKKDGTRSKKDAVFHICEGCHTMAKGGKSKKFPTIVVDHIDPVVPIEGGISWSEFIQRVFCDPDNLQKLCTPCHAAKSKLENQLRRQYKKDHP